MAASEDIQHPDLEVGLWSGADIDRNRTHPRTAALIDLWRSKKDRNNPLAPVPRSKMDVLELQPWFGLLVLYDFIRERDDYLCRIFGNQVRDLQGVDMTNRYLSEYPEEIRHTTRSQYDWVRHSNEPLLLRFMSTRLLLGRIARNTYAAEKVILPLSRGGDDQVDCFLTLNLPLEPAFRGSA